MHASPEPGPRAGAAAARLLAAALCLGAVLAPGGVAVASADAEVALPVPRHEGDVSVERALAARRSLRRFAREPLPLAAASQLLWAAQGVTDRDGHRTAPSAGALYPLETYLVAGAVSGLAPGVYRYDPRRHRLALAKPGDPRQDVARAALDQDWVGEAPAILAIAGVYRRTERKYRRRAPRYVHMEVGHAAQNVYLQAEALGLGTTVVGAFRDEELARALGLPERTVPLALLPVGRPR